MAPVAAAGRDRFDPVTRMSWILPASRWFVLVAAAAVLAVVGLALIADHLSVTIPVDSPQALRLAAFVQAADAALLLLFGFAIVPPATRYLARLLFRARRRAEGEHPHHAICRVIDLVTLGVWALGAVAIGFALPLFSDLMTVASLFSRP